jgi:hypothetical protein
MFIILLEVLEEYYEVIYRLMNRLWLYHFNSELYDLKSNVAFSSA